MDNFDLRKYLAEGKLFENTINQISSRIVKLGKEAGISSDDIEEYVYGLESSFEPDAYKNITDKELLKDLKLAVKNLAEGKLLKEDRNVEDVLKKAGFSFEDGILGGVGSGGAGYYDSANDAMYGYNQSGPWNEEEFNKFYDNFSFSSNVYEKEFAEENDDDYDYDMVAQMLKPGIYSIGDDGYVEIRSNGDIKIYAIPQLSDEEGTEFISAFKMDASGKAIPQLSKDEMRKMLKDDMYYII